MNVCVSQATTLTTDLLDDFAGHADGGALGTELWLTKLETYLAHEQPIEAVKRLLQERSLQVPIASFQGGLLLSQGEARAVHFDHYKRRLQLCQELKIPMILVTTDYQMKPDQDNFGRSLVSLKQAAQWAEAFGVRVALEFRGNDAYLATLDSAITFVEAAAEPNLGICLDWFHYYKGASKPEDLDRLTKQNLFHVQLSDVAGVPRELMSDQDRIFPGEGDFRYDKLRTTLHRISYEGWLSVELMNPVLWQLKSSQVVELALTALRNVFA